MRSLSFTTQSVRVAAIAALLLSAAVSRAQQSSVLWTKSALFSAPRAIVSSPDGELVAVIDKDSLVRVWHTRTGDLVGMLARGNNSVGRSVHTGAGGLRFDSEGRLYTVGFRVDTVYRWRLSDMTCEAALHVPSVGRNSVFDLDPVRREVLQFDSDFIYVRSIEADSARSIRIQKSPTESVHSMKFTADGRSILLVLRDFSSGELSIRSLDRSSGAQRFRFDPALPAGVRRVAISGNGRVIVGAGNELVFSVDADGNVDTASIRIGDWLAISDDGGHAISGGGKGPVFFVDLGDGMRLDAVDSTLALGTEEGLTGAVSVGDRERVVFLANGSSDLFTYDQVGQRTLRRLTVPAEDVRSLGFAPDDSAVVLWSRPNVSVLSGSNLHSPYTRRASSDKVVVTELGVLGLVPTSDSNLRYVVEWLGEDTIGVVRVPGTLLLFTSDGTHALVTDGPTASLVDISNGQRVETFAIDWRSPVNGGLIDAVVSTDRRWIAVRRGYNGPFGLYEGGTKRHVLTGTENGSIAGFSPSGKELLVWRLDTAHFAETETGILRSVPIDRMYWIRYVTDSTLVGCRRDGAVVLFDREFRPILQYGSIQGIPVRAEISSDRRSIAVVMVDRRVILLSLAWPASVSRRYGARFHGGADMSVALESDRLVVRHSIVGDVTVRIVDLQGVVLWHREFQDVSSHPIVADLDRSLPAGAYFVEVLYPNGRVSKKALLQDRTD